jgi:RHS repeat-associated protein
MVEQQNGSTYTQMLYSQIGKTAIMNGQTLSKAFVALPGGGTAIYKSTGLAYCRHADWLGSSRLTSTPARAVHSDSAYAPFGEEYTKSGTDDPSFTGQNADTNSTLYDFTFREYSPSQGRWVSPDPAGLAAAHLSAPQSWNRYAYVLNNPLIATDPSGLDCVYDEGGGTLAVKWGDCYSSTDNGYYVNCDGCLFDSQGNPTTFTLNPDGSLGFEYATGVGVGYILGFADPFSGSETVNDTATFDPVPTMPANNGQTPQQKNQDCLNKINNTPDGKFYNSFSYLSPLIGPDAGLGEVGKEAAKEGTKRFFKAGAMNWARTGLGSMSGFVSNVWETVDAALFPVNGAATAGQVAVHIGCALAAP